MRVLDRDIDILFAARSSKKEAAAQAIFLHATGDAIIPGALWWQMLASWKRHPLQRSPPPAADASSSSERDWQELQRRTHGEASLDRQTKPAAGSLVPAPVFFSQLLANTKEGYFADPLYGGNRGMAAWKWIGFPGARADFTDWIDQAGRAYMVQSRSTERAADGGASEAGRRRYQRLWVGRRDYGEGAH